MTKTTNNTAKRFIVIGGGAAGFFGAITCAEANEYAKITILERGKEVLQKVKISGGGRCNLAHDCFDARELIKNYPRGSKALLGPFHRFGTQQTLDWFERHGVDTHTEMDGRIFPVTNDSETILECLEGAAYRLGIEVRTSTRVEYILPPDTQNDTFRVVLADDEILEAEAVLVAAGSSPAVWQWLYDLGHTIIKPVPSLFTFNIRDPRLTGLSGISVADAEVKIVGEKSLQAKGALLITHWGLSAPSILRLSAWGARRLHELNYQFDIAINWAGGYSQKDILAHLHELKIETPKRQINNYQQFDLPSRLWQRLVAAAKIAETQTWANCTKVEMQALAEQIGNTIMSVKGKSTFKEEFVTAGGVSLDEVDFSRFESRLHKNLFLAGEILDIDAITGGFNFQAAWTGGFHAGTAAAE
jgi:predicted Rossmann fold flavoprotein